MTERRPSTNGRSRVTRSGAALLAVTLVGATALTLVSTSPASAGALPSAPRLISRDNAGATIKGTVAANPRISGDGRFVAFVTGAAVVPSDTNGKKDVYVRDLWAGVTELVSLTDADQPVQGDSLDPSISNDGRYVTFLTAAPNMITGDNKGKVDAFLRDRYKNTTKWINVGIGGVVPNDPVTEAKVSGNGAVTAFVTNSAAMVPNDTNAASDVFVRNNAGSTIERVSLNSSEGQGTGYSIAADISDDGRYVVFQSLSLFAGGVLGAANVYVRDRTNGTTALVNIINGGGSPNAGAGTPTISGNGRYVAFNSAASNIVTGDTNNAGDAFLRDLATSTVTRVSLTDADGQINADSGTIVDGISYNGLTVLFTSIGVATSGTDTGTDYDVFLRTTGANTTTRISTGPGAPDPNVQQLEGSMSSSGQQVAFHHSAKLTNESFDQGYVYGPVSLGPLTSSAEFIQQQYKDFLGRAATSTEVSTWTNRFAIAATGTPALIAALAADPAFAANRAPLVRLYWAFFLRRPDAGGLTYWLGRYQSGATLSQIAQSFAKSPEFTARYGSVTNEGYVKLVYQNVFNRQPDPGGLAYWTDRLNAGTITRGGVVLQFSESAEGVTRLAGPTNLTLISLGMFLTVPSAALWDSVYSVIAAGETRAAYIAGRWMETVDYGDRFF